ncbi:hypothetical protein GW765_00930 [Candidatus Parcubacteria bacterium]|uniref:Bacterial spore germination immunoglobulin-like domain-containing protein n=1 Tax=Candidatus Magasanikbacteria bacterium CG10_big_fil_rev_8_21_14_0_10_38_6 TaxID=1974647 RepID=A0A2M6NZT7_9BACT|nr:hypothetical protein [Candidatus Parcubacteria bacterium]PIR76974.1 MAG: hypothetical protein COU30_04920 [Candidatus Magasanikbacteria bacterium CG10_big_fil_rev_8_21_14_0_10_38_6]
MNTQRIIVLFKYLCITIFCGVMLFIGYQYTIEYFDYRSSSPVDISVLDSAAVDSPEVSEDVEQLISLQKDLIRVVAPEAGSTISSPLTVRGIARGTWFFEGTFPIILVDWDGLILAESYASFVPDPNDPESTWMTEDFVDFEGTIDFDVPTETLGVSTKGTIIFKKDNPSGLSEHDAALEIPIVFGS